MAGAKKVITPISKLRGMYGRPETQFYDTGIFLLNDIWGGGMPTGTVIEFHSEEGLGKTTIVVQVARYLVSKHKLKVAYLDIEAALNESLRNNLGITEFEKDDVNEPSFFYTCPGTYDEVTNAMMNLIMNSNYDVIIYDSIANTGLDAELGDDGQYHIPKKIGQHAQMQGEMLKMVKNRLARVGKTLIIINQMRAVINLNPMSKGPSVTPAGGHVLDHNFDIRTAITKRQWLLNDNKERIGTELILTTIKNKITTPFRQVGLNLIFGRGIDKTQTLLNILIDREIASRAGAWYSLPNGQRFNGQEALKDYVRNNYNECLTMIGDSSYAVDVLNDKLKEDIKASSEVSETKSIVEKQEILPNVDFENESTVLEQETKEDGKE